MNKFSIQNIMKLKLENPNATEILIDSFRLNCLINSNPNIMHDFFYSNEKTLFGLKIIRVEVGTDYLRLL